MKTKGNLLLFIRKVCPIPASLAILALSVLLFLLFSHSVMSDSLQPHGQQHIRFPCPSTNPRACSNSCPLSWWCHPTISSPIVPFYSCPQSFPASGSFPMSQFISSGWPNDWSFSFSISPSKAYSGLISARSDWFDLLAVQGTLKSFLQHHSSKASILQFSVFFRCPLLRWRRSLLFLAYWVFIRNEYLIC